MMTAQEEVHIPTMSIMLCDGSSLFVSSSFLFAFLASFLSFLLCGGDDTAGATTQHPSAIAIDPTTAPTVHFHCGGATFYLR